MSKWTIALDNNNIPLNRVQGTCWDNNNYRAHGYPFLEVRNNINIIERAVVPF